MTDLLVRCARYQLLAAYISRIACIAASVHRAIDALAAAAAVAALEVVVAASATAAAAASTADSRSRCRGSS